MYKFFSVDVRHRDMCMQCSAAHTQIYVFLLGIFQARLCGACLRMLRKEIDGVLPGDAARHMDLLQSLYEEFGRETVGIVRRELTTKLSRLPNYVELVAELMRQQGWRSPPLAAGSDAGDEHA